MKRTNRLRVLRAEKRKTQRDTALRANISRDRYWRIENGYEVPTPAEMKRLARALRVQVADAFPSSEQVSA